LCCRGIMESHGIEDVAWAIEDIGGRQTLEDDYDLVIGLSRGSPSVLAAVFDGHGGPEVARLAAARFPVLFRNSLNSGVVADEAIRAAFMQIDKESLAYESGAVAVACWLKGGEVVFANAGDAELLLISKGSHVPLTEMHRLSNSLERARILRAGGGISGSYVTLPDGSGLECTRAIGDWKFRRVGIIADPRVGLAPLGQEDLWLVAACDGLWDVMDHAEVADVARRGRTPRAVAEALHHEAVEERDTPDNLTVIAMRVDFR